MTAPCTGCGARLAELEARVRRLENNRTVIVADDDEPAQDALQVVDRVAREYELTRGQLLGRRRDRRVSAPRHVAMWLVRELTELPLVDVGMLFGGRDHTTVLHAVKQVAAQVRFRSGDGPTAARLRAALRPSARAQAVPA